MYSGTVCCDPPYRCPISRDILYRGTKYSGSVYTRTLYLEDLYIGLRIGPATFHRLIPDVDEENLIR